MSASRVLRSWTRRRVVLVGVVVAVLLGALVALPRLGSDGGPPLMTDDVAEEPVEETAPEADDQEVADEEAAHRPPEEADGPPSGDDGEAVAVSAARHERDLVRDAQLELAYDDFDAAYSGLRTAARDAGGQLTDAEVTREDGTAHGTAVLEVPSEELEATLEAIAELGEVRGERITTDDVTDQLVNLDARLSHLEETEAFYLQLFDDAEDVDDALALQERLEGVQQQLEEVRAHRDHLAERTRSSEVTVDLVPPDEAAVAAAAGDGVLAGYWDEAVAAFLAVTGTLLVILGGAAPILAVLATLTVIAVALIRTPRRPQTAATPPRPATTGDAVD